MKNLALIGYPIDKSLSPKLWENFVQKTGLNPKEYSYSLLQGEDFEEIWREFLNNYHGINITAPFKELAYKKVLEMQVREPNLDVEVSGPCFKIGASNLIVKKPNGGFSVQNTDFNGFILCIAEAFYPNLVQQCKNLYKEQFYIRVHQFLRANLPELFDKKPQALIIGCGGTGKAAAIACAELGFDTSIINRTSEKAERFAAKYPEYGILPHPIKDFAGAVKECDLVIYTIAKEFYYEGENLLEQLTTEIFEGEDNLGLRPSKVFIDVNYQELVITDKIKKNISEANAQYVNGVQLLQYQAEVGFPQFI